MGIKLQKINQSSFLKGLLFTICIICLGILLTIFLHLISSVDNIESLTVRKYQNSKTSLQEPIEVYYKLADFINYKNDENIKKIVRERVNEEEKESSEKSSEEDIENKINKEILSFKQTKRELQNLKEILYYATDGDVTITNCNYDEKKDFTKHKVRILVDKYGSDYLPKVDLSNFALESNSNSIEYGNNQDNLKIYLAVKDNLIAMKQKEWEKTSNSLDKVLKVVIAAVLLIVLAMIWLIWIIGKKDSRKEVHFLTIDRLYTDVNMGMILISFGCYVYLIGNVFHSDFIKEGLNYFFDLGLNTILIIILNSLFAGVLVTLFLSLIKHLKNKTLIKHSIIYNILKVLINFVKMFLTSGPVYLKALAVIVIANAFISFIGIILMFASFEVKADVLVILFLMLILGVSIFGELYYLVYILKDFEKISLGVKEIRNGNVNHEIMIKKDGVMKNLANDINTINEGIKESVKKEVKAERMKAELVTNVSHDLKTPLTSIINYTDLLAKENLAPEVANEYVKTIQKKAAKLKKLTDDLFEVAKIQGGDLKVAAENIDIVVLIKQILGEFESQIAKSNLNFKMKAPKENIYIQGDGKRLSRAFENLVLNNLKYSLANTRVYIDIYAKENAIIVEFKNTANYEMDFNDDEIKERFVRGDKARTTDGNGLGLAIAESYVKACKGRLRVKVDGDLFKVTMTFAKSK